MENCKVVTPARVNLVDVEDMLQSLTDRSIDVYTRAQSINLLLDSSMCKEPEESGKGMPCEADPGTVQRLRNRIMQIHGVMDKMSVAIDQIGGSIHG